MVDNVAITAGSGTSIAADDISSVFYQRVKPSHGADGSAVDTSETDPLPVRSIAKIFTVTLSTDTSAYADGDVLADTQSVSNVFLTSGGGRVLQSVTVLDKADQGFGFDLYFLDANNSLGTENAAPSISDANAEAILGRVAISSADYYDIGGAKLATRTGIGLLLQGNASTTLYVAAIARGAGTYGASDLIVKLGFV